MKANIIMLFLIAGMISCQKDNTTQTATTTATYQQDARLVGGWRLDSTVSPPMTGHGFVAMVADSIRFILTANAHDSVEYLMFFIAGSTVMPAASAYNWETKSDSIFFPVLGHGIPFSNNQDTCRFIVNGNRLHLIGVSWPALYPDSIITSHYYLHR